jgi:putative DNA primase/helicase
MSGGGTLVETYLRSRGIVIPMPATLRFHSQMNHPRREVVWPAMIALVTHGSDDTPLNPPRLP